MKRIAFLALALALVGFVATAAAPSRSNSVERPANVQSPSNTDALQTIDYWGAGGASFYTWNGFFYMSNLFKPDAGWYPLDVLSLDVMPARLDGGSATGATGTLDGVGVFDTAGVVLARELNVAASIGYWVNVPMTTAPRISTGNFYGGLWNSTSIEGGLQTTATNWAAPPTEPFNCLDGTVAGANAAGPFTPSFCGTQYATVSAASVIANIDSNVPVELMRFGIE